MRTRRKSIERVSAVKIFASASISIPSSSVTFLVGVGACLDSVAFRRGEGISVPKGTRQGVLQIMEHGIYSVKAQVNFASGAAGDRALIINADRADGSGVVPVGTVDYIPGSAAQQCYLNGGVDLELKPGSLLSVSVAQVSAGALNAVGDSIGALTFMSAFKVSD